MLSKDCVRDKVRFATCASSPPLRLLARRRVWGPVWFVQLHDREFECKTFSLGKQSLSAAPALRQAPGLRRRWRRWRWRWRWRRRYGGTHELAEQRTRRRDPRRVVCKRAGGPGAPSTLGHGRQAARQKTKGVLRRHLPDTHLGTDDGVHLRRSQLPPFQRVDHRAEQPRVPPVDQLGRERMVGVGEAVRGNVEWGPRRIHDLVSGLKIQGDSRGACNGVLSTWLEGTA